MVTNRNAKLIGLLFILLTQACRQEASLDDLYLKGFSAISEGDVEKFDEILNSDIDVGLYYVGPDSTAEKHSFGLTLLHWAARKGRVDFVQKLLEEGADPYVLDQNRKLPIQLAIKNEHYEVCEVFKKFAVTQDEDMLKRRLIIEALLRWRDQITLRGLTINASPAQRDLIAALQLHGFSEMDEGMSVNVTVKKENDSKYSYKVEEIEDSEGYIGGELRKVWGYWVIDNLVSADY